MKLAWRYPTSVWYSLLPNIKTMIGANLMFVATLTLLGQFKLCLTAMLFSVNLTCKMQLYYFQQENKVIFTIDISKVIIILLQ